MQFGLKDIMYHQKMILCEIGGQMLLNISSLPVPLRETKKALPTLQLFNIQNPHQKSPFISRFFNNFSRRFSCTMSRFSFNAN